VDDTLLQQARPARLGAWAGSATPSPPPKSGWPTASGQNWVVVAVAICLPFSTAPILALPLLARLHRPGKPSRVAPELARQLLGELLSWFPDRRFTLVGRWRLRRQGLLTDLDERVTFVGRLRGDAALFDPGCRPPPGSAGRKARKGPGCPAEGRRRQGRP